MTTKIDANDVKDARLDLFGEWLEGEVSLVREPYKHCIIHNFLTEETFSKLEKELPLSPSSTWWRYNNPLEVKYALDDFEAMGPTTRSVFHGLSRQEVCDKLSEVFEIERLSYDPFCHGGGLHMHPRHGRLDMHLDYEKHPYLPDRQRKLNIIVYLNDNWNDEWNGDTQLWDSTVENCVVRSYPRRNTAIVFETSDISWHGVPERITCPDGMFRRSLAFYYLSDINNDPNYGKKGGSRSGYREKAVFTGRPTEALDQRLDQLRRIRPHRRITSGDMETLWPEWTPAVY